MRTSSAAKAFLIIGVLSASSVLTAATAAAQGAPAAAVNQGPPVIVNGSTVPPAVNVGTAGIGTASGAGGVAADPSGRGEVSFDYSSFCNAAARDGRPRSPAWVQRCLASQN